MNSYFVKKLKDKVNARRKINGLELYTTEQVKNNNILDLNQMPNDWKVTQENGRYRIKGKNSFNNDFTLNLSSSEYIEFSLQELREIKLNQILPKSE